MKTTTETLEDIHALDQELVCVPVHADRDYWCFLNLHSAKDFYTPIAQSRGQIIDWLVEKGCDVQIHQKGLVAYVLMYDKQYHKFVWKDALPRAINAESELHSLLLCVLEVLRSEK